MFFTRFYSRWSPCIPIPCQGTKRAYFAIAHYPIRQPISVTIPLKATDETFDYYFSFTYFHSLLRIRHISYTYRLKSC